MQVKVTTTVDVQAKDKTVKPLDLAAIVQSEFLGESDSAGEITSATRSYMDYALVTFKWTEDMEVKGPEDSADVSEPERIA